MDVNRQKELQAAYLCVKKSVADNLSSHDEVKRALQYGGFNPNDSYVKSCWNKNSATGIAFENFLELSLKLKVTTEDDVVMKFCNVFGTGDSKVKLSEFLNILSMEGESEELSKSDLLFILKEADAIQDDSVDCAKITLSINQTIRKLKQLSIEKMEEKANNQKMNSKTFTKRQHKLNASAINGSSTWYTSVLKGNFYLEGSAIVSHHYRLNISCDGETVVKIEPSAGDEISPSNATVDVLAYIFKETNEGARSFIGVTDRKDSDGVCFWQGNLAAGNYLIIPFTSGCHLPLHTASKATMSLFTRTAAGQVLLTKEFKSLLLQIFDQLDLDSSGGLSRQEFNLYNWRTSGEEVQDDEWAVVQSNFAVHNNELTPEGFLDLHQLEAEDSGGVEDDLWLSLQSMGYNKAGQVTTCASYSISALSQVCNPTLIICGLRTGGLLLDKAIVRSAMESSEPVRIKNMLDLIKYQYTTRDRACIVLQNKSQRVLRLTVDISESTNVISHRKNLKVTLELPPKSAIVAHHVLPKDPNVPWQLACYETLL